mmetsp:Transcript_66859/g.186692  ORF Transcript_66859/g.186692 Transcript_66859/m.186692 type:complete len:233 (+) Transcript_66859:608-1306(+)
MRQLVRPLLLLLVEKVRPRRESVEQVQGLVLATQHLECGCSQMLLFEHRDLVKPLSLLEFHLDLPLRLRGLQTVRMDPPARDDHEQHHWVVATSQDRRVLQQSRLLLSEEVPGAILELGDFAVPFIHLVLVDDLHLGPMLPIQEARVGETTRIAFSEAHHGSVHRLLTPILLGHLVLYPPPVGQDRAQQPGDVSLYPLPEHELGSLVGTGLPEIRLTHSLPELVCVHLPLVL